MLKVMIEYIINKEDIYLRGYKTHPVLYIYFFVAYFGDSKMIKERRFGIRIDYFDKIFPS